MNTKTPSKASSRRVPLSVSSSTTVDSRPSPLNSATVVCGSTCMAEFSATFSCTTLLAVSPSPIVAIVTSGENLVRNTPSSPALLPPPTTSSRLPR